MNKFMNGLKNENNFGYTENGAVKRMSTMSSLLDLFGMGAAYRNRSDTDCIFLFQKAFKENPVYALKCLFYIRDVRGGQGERRFFRVVTKWLADHETDAMARNLQYVPEFGRWDDLYEFVNTKLETAAFKVMEDQICLDIQCKTPSLLAKWLKSENTSSKTSRELANKTRIAFGLDHRQYRKMLSALRERINVVERLMSAGKWDEIEFDKIPSKAGFQYRNAFARHDIERMKSEKQVRTYEDFMKDEKTTVNAKDLYPYEVVDQAINLTRSSYGGWGYESNPNVDSVQRNVINKYWENFMESLDDFLGLDCLCICDTSGSMLSGGIKGGTPMDVAISLSLCAAEKARGPFAHHYISFSSRPQLIKVEGVDFVDTVKRICQTNLCENTDIEATFDMLLNTALKQHCKQSDLPEALVIISDQEFDAARGYYLYYHSAKCETATLMEQIEAKWNAHGYKMPKLYFWNVNAKQENIPMTLKDGVTFVSGLSPVLFKQIASGKTAEDFVFDILDSERYAVIH